MNMDDGNKLFEAYSYAQWEEEALKKSQIQDIKDLVWQIDDHISIMPLQPDQDKSMFPTELHIRSSCKLDKTLHLITT